MEFEVRSGLSPEQLQVCALYQLAGVTLDENTFKALWKLVSLHIPASTILCLLKDIAAASA